MRTACCTTSPKGIVPKRFSAVIQASGAAGITVRRMPSGMAPLYFRTKCSGSAAAGQLPRPAMVHISPSAMRIMMGATPATFTMSGCTTPSVMPPATAASTALPPASRIAKAACAAA
jgi:hypothetical protein